MIWGIILYCWQIVVKESRFLGRMMAACLNVIVCRLNGRLPAVYFYGHCDYIHHLSLANKSAPCYEITVLTLRLAHWLGLRAAVTIDLTRFNYFYLPEMVNQCLTLQRRDPFDVLTLADPLTASLFEGYVKLVENINLKLRAENIVLRLRPDDESVIGNVLKSIDRKIADGPDPLVTFCNKFKVFEEIKKQSPTRSGRYLSLYAEEVTAGPEIVVLDIYHKCNTDCVHCWMHSPTARKFLSREFLGEKMDFATMKQIVDDCSKLGVDLITLLGDGEPVLNPDFQKILMYSTARNYNLTYMTFSNGLAVTPAMSHTLVNNGLKEIWFSVPAATGETYRRVCPSKTEKDFQRVKENITYLCRLKKNLKGIYRVYNKVRGRKNITRGRHRDCFPPYCVIAYVLHAGNFHEIVDMAKMAVEIGVDEMRFQLIHLDKDNKALQLTAEQIDFLNARLPEVYAIAGKAGVDLSSALKFQLSNMYVPTGDWSKGFYLEHGCPIGFFFTIIKANGDVGLCCGLKVIDNIRKTSFYDVWMSAAYKRGRCGAKRLAQNKDMAFLPTTYHKDEKRGDLLYSERCEYCDNHDLNNQYIATLQQAGLYERIMKS